MRLTKSVPHTQFLWNVVYNIMNDFLYGIQLEIYRVESPIELAMKVSTTVKDYYSTDNPLGLYEEKIKKMVVKLVSKLFEEFIENLSRQPEPKNLEDFYMIDCEKISKKLINKKLILCKEGTPIKFKIDPEKTFITLEDFDEETRLYETAMYISGKFTINSTFENKVYIV